LGRIFFKSDADSRLTGQNETQLQLTFFIFIKEGKAETLHYEFRLTLKIFRKKKLCQTDEQGELVKVMLS
jgi:hypothetical protein